MSDKVTGAYYQRNMLALFLAISLHNQGYKCGYYIDKSAPEGYKRVISICSGSYTFHVPDSFDMIGLPLIENNWDGHTSKEKFNRMYAQMYNLLYNDKLKKRFDKLIKK